MFWNKTTLTTMAGAISNYVTDEDGDLILTEAARERVEDGEEILSPQEEEEMFAFDPDGILAHMKF